MIICTYMYSYLLPFLQDHVCPRFISESLTMSRSQQYLLESDLAAACHACPSNYFSHATGVREMPKAVWRSSDLALLDGVRSG